MPFVTTNGSAPQSYRLRALKRALDELTEQANAIGNQLPEMEDLEVEQQIGFPQGDPDITMANFRSNIASLVADLDRSAFVNFRTRIGFDG